MLKNQLAATVHSCLVCVGFPKKIAKLCSENVDLQINPVLSSSLQSLTRLVPELRMFLALHQSACHPIALGGTSKTEELFDISQLPSRVEGLFIET